MQFDADTTHRYLQFVMPPETCIEFRIFKADFGKGGYVVAADRYASTLAGWYDDAHALVRDAGRLRGVSGFVTFNPVSRDLLCRCDNKLMKAKETTKDEDILAIRWLYVDIDPTRAAGISSTDEELGLAVSMRNRILLDYPELATHAISGKSGNGCWILVKLPDYPNNAEHRDLVGRTLAFLSGRYSTDRVKIDVSTKNPARVMCLPGTIKAKGSNRPERPWRNVTMDTEGQICEGNPL